MCACLLATPAVSKEPPSADGPGVSKQLIESRIEEVRAAKDLDEPTRTLLNGLHRKAVSFIEAARSSSIAADAFAQSRETAPAEAQRIRQEFEQAQAEAEEVTLDLPKEASASVIVQSLQQERANQAAATAKLKGFEHQLAVEANRPGVARQRLVEAGQLGDKLGNEMKSPPPPDEAALVSEARRWALSNQANAVAAEIRMLDEELRSRRVRLQLLKAQRDATSRSLTRIASRVALLEERLARQRRSETEKVIADADDAARSEGVDHPLVIALITKNGELGEELTRLTNELEKVEAAATAAANESKAIQKNFQTARQRLEIAGLSQALGQILHDQRRDLPDLRRYQRRAARRVDIIAVVGLRDTQLEAERRESQHVASYIERLLADVPLADRERLSTALGSLVTSRRALLKQTEAANSEYLRALGDLNFEEFQLLSGAEEFDAYLAERLLWVRSKGPVGLESIFVLPREVVGFLAPQQWLEAVEVLSTPTVALALLVAVLLLIGAGSLRVRLRATRSEVGRPSSDRFALTAQAVVYSVLLSVSWPLLTGAAAFEISRSLDASEGVKAIGVGLLQIARILFFLRLFRVICMSGGLAEVHFKWPSSSVVAFRRQLDQLLITFVIPVFVLTYSFTLYPADFGGELGRLSFLLGTTGVVVFLVQLLRPEKGILEELRRSIMEAPERLSWLWLALGTTVPLALVAAALAGYLYSATILMSSLISTLWLALGITIVHELAARWLLIVQQRLLFGAALERAEADRVAREHEGEATAGEDIPVPEEPEVDVASIDQDTRLLLNVGLLAVSIVLLGAIWSSVLPALAILRDVTLWEYLEGATGEEKLVPVTLAEFGIALLYGVMTYVSVRTLPSLLEVVLRLRGTTDSGSRLAYATLARYLILILGVSLMAGTVGFHWNNFQWLVAALGVGIGFGLQEIVANFISGLIILVERPVRVGDIVTVGDVSGVVTRMQIRATTVTNWDRQELLVPNQEFITGRVLNWSLSDEVIRIVLKVGVEYGSDMRTSLKLISEALEENERVLRDPKPLVTFDEFGDNSLNITARVYIGSLANRWELASDLNLAINDKLTEAGIVVAFPQRDVHLETASPLEIRIQPTVREGSS